MQWLYDCRDLWEYSKGFNLECLAVRVQELHATERVRMMLRIFMRNFPRLIEPEEFERCFPQSMEYDRLLVNGQKSKDAFTKFLSYGYNKHSAMTPIHIFRALWVEYVQYCYLKPELQLASPKMSFVRFIRDFYGIDSFSDLAKGYLSRIRLFEKRERED